MWLRTVAAHPSAKARARGAGQRQQFSKQLASAARCCVRFHVYQAARPVPLLLAAAGRQRIAWTAAHLSMQQRATPEGARLLVIAAGLDVKLVESRLKMLRQATGELWARAVLLCCRAGGVFPS